MNQAIINRANQLLNDKEYGHELNIDKALRLAQEEADERAQCQAEKSRKAALWNEYKADLRAAGVSEQAMKTLATSSPALFFQLPELIAIGRIGFSSKEREVAVKAAMRKLWVAAGYGEPQFSL